MKYKLFRSPGDLDKAVRTHELVAVETGKRIDDVAVCALRDCRLCTGAGQVISPGEALPV